MRVLRDILAVPAPLCGAVVAVGNFDGVHRGHQAVIREAGRLARAAGAPHAVVTFEPHPRRYFKPDAAPFELTPPDAKARQMAALGVDLLVVIPFDAEMAKKTAYQFVMEALVRRLTARHVVVGFDFVFGNARGGNVEVLQAMSHEEGFGFTAVAPERDAEATIYSSTAARTHLAQGRPHAAAEILGRPWEIEGIVETGDKRGRTIGFPTANLALDLYLEPALGAYAVWAGIVDGATTSWHKGVANIGRRPTFDKTRVNLEAHLFDFTGDLYGKVLRVALVEHLRPERKFDGIEGLKAQIAADGRAALAAIEAHDPRALPSAPLLV